MQKKLKPSSERPDTSVIVCAVATFLVIIWLFLPPLNKIEQFKYWGNNIQFACTRMFNNNPAVEYIYHKKNSVYLVKMYPDNLSKALEEINKAIKTAPGYVSDNELEGLYHDRARIRLFMRDYKGALDDFMKVKNIEFLDRLPIALMLAEKKQFSMAMKQCKKILELDGEAFSGYACMAEIYNQAGKKDAAINVYTFVLDKKKNNYWALLERSKIKKSLNDIKGADEDFAKAKEYARRITAEDSYFEEATSPKMIILKTE